MPANRHHHGRTSANRATMGTSAARLTSGVAASPAGKNLDYTCVTTTISECVFTMTSHCMLYYAN